MTDTTSRDDSRDSGPEDAPATSNGRAPIEEWANAIGAGLAMTEDGHDALHLVGQYKRWCTKCRAHSESLRVVSVKAASH